METEDACDIYLSTTKDRCMSDMTDLDVGLPQLNTAVMETMFGGDKVSLYLEHNTTGDGLLHGESKGVKGFLPSLCVEKIPKFIDGSLVGKDMQDCINAFVIEHGEELLESLICDTIVGGASGGIGIPLCHSRGYKAIMGVVNHFLNSLVEQPLIDEMDKIEDAIASGAKKVFEWFDEKFHSDNKRCQWKKLYNKLGDTTMSIK